MAVKLITDSASDININEATELGITLVPMEITFEDGEEFLDGVTLFPREFYEKLIESTALPKTSQINPFRFEEEYQKITANGDDAIVITISSGLSGTYSNAVAAAKKYASRVFVVDSKNACIGQRLLCRYALELIGKGMAAGEIADELNRVKGKINVMAMLDTLTYLKKGGRISAAVAFAGELLSIKPVIGVVDGKIKLIGKARGSKKANNLLNSLVEEKGGINFDMPYGVVWSGLSDDLLKKYVTDSAHLWENHTDDVPAYVIGSTIGTHVGPGAIGVAFFEK